jgi:hypothetical protein
MQAGMTQDREANDGRRRGTRATRIAALAALTLGGALSLFIVASSCSITNVKYTACTSDTQCSGVFGAGSTCQQGFCSDPSSMADCNQSGADGLPCYGCPPTTQTQFHTACTTAACQPFDNATRLTKLTADGGLPPLP